MFRGWTAEALFRLDDYQHAQLILNKRAITAFSPASGPAHLASLWVVWYRFDDSHHHIDL